jgi:hypothetical protein
VAGHEDVLRSCRGLAKHPHPATGVTTQRQLATNNLAPEAE